MRKIDWKIIAKDIDNQTSISEKKKLKKWLDASEQHYKYYNKVKQNYFKQPSFDKKSYEADFLKLKKRLVSHSLNIQSYKTSRFRNFIIYSSVACIVAGLLCGIFQWTSNHKPDDIQILKEISEHHLPGTNKATLFIDNHEYIALGQNPVLLDLRGVKITNSTKEGLTYQETEKSSPILNKLVVPRGGEYKVILSDSSIVWLNSESTLEYPSIFEGNTRRVSLIGEGYFKISKNEKKPFIIETADTEIEVLGTEFNVSAYPDNSYTTTTLVEGSVKIEYKTIDRQDILKPGMQSYYNIKENSSQISYVDTEFNTSWKNKIFSFNDTPLEDLLKIVSRWYNFKYTIKDSSLLSYHFSGELSRKKNLDYLFRVLEEVGIPMEISYKNGTVTLDKK